MIIRIDDLFLLTTTTTITTTTVWLSGFYLGEPVPERQNQEGKTNLDLLEQETVIDSGT